MTVEQKRTSCWACAPACGRVANVDQHGAAGAFARMRTLTGLAIEVGPAPSSAAAAP